MEGGVYDLKCWKVSTSVGDVLIPYAGPKFSGQHRVSLKYYKTF